MLNIRTIVLSIGLVLILILTVPLVAARTEVVSDPASDAASDSENQPPAADLINTYDAPSYRSQFGECYDVSIRDLAACREASEAAIQVETSAVDECFDVSNISELAACRDANQAAIQEDYPAVDECFDVSLWEVASCHSTSQSSTP